MQCKDCTHQIICMHKGEFEKLEGMLPTTMPPFKTTVTCVYYKQEQPQVRSDVYGRLENIKVTL